MLNPTVTMDDLRSLSYAARGKKSNHSSVIARVISSPFSRLPLLFFPHHPRLLASPRAFIHSFIRAHSLDKRPGVSCRVAIGRVIIVSFSRPPRRRVPRSRRASERIDVRTISSERGERLERLGAVHDGVAHARRTQLHVGSRGRIRPAVGGGVFAVDDGASDGEASRAVRLGDGFIRRPMRRADARRGGRGARRRRGHGARRVSSSVRVACFPWADRVVERRVCSSRGFPDEWSRR